jgi:hypothetical protein
VASGGTSLLTSGTIFLTRRTSGTRRAMTNSSRPAGRLPPEQLSGPHVLRFGLRAVANEQASILRAALEAVRVARGLAAFDLDSTLLSNKPRQARIVREFGEQVGDARLARCPAEAIISWDLRDSLRLCGLTAEEAAARFPAIKEFWRERFFTSEYCRDDVPIAGAPEYVRAALEQGGRVLYLTGRHTEMGPGTVVSFERGGFPLPDGGRVQLWLKPEFEDSDDAFKELMHARLTGEGGVAAAFDNEPTHVNAYKLAFPSAFVVHLDTDHSGRPVEVLETIPSVVDFTLGR